MDQAVTGYERTLIEDVGDFVALEGGRKALHSASMDGYLSKGFDRAQFCWEKGACEE
jgi:hypothetical protein